MTQSQRLLLGLVFVWAAVFVGSYYLATRIEGPRTLDTGFRRLDVLFKGQLLAFGLGLTTAILGFFWRHDGKRMLMLGLVPMAATALVVAGSVIAALVIEVPGPPDAGPTAPSPSPPAATAIPVD